MFGAAWSVGPKPDTVTVTVTDTVRKEKELGALSSVCRCS